MADFLENGDEFLTAYAANVERLRAAGADDLELERDGCGVGCVVAIDGKPRREVVVKGIEALKAVWHRGAVDADGKTGDGAGIHVQIPQDFFREQIKGAVDTDTKVAVGMVFLPRNSFAQQEACRTLVESEILRFGYAIRGWRQVPVDTTALGEKAQATRPEIEQIIIGNPKRVDEDAFERDLYVIRRRVERLALADNITDFYICSLSCRSVIYKGLFLAEQLAVFYPDLNDERFVSSFALFHQRYSTNTLPSWKLAQPFRVLAHNGEINTLRGNVNWMRSHETRMWSEVFGPYNDDIKPVIQAGSSDSAALDAVFEALVRAGRQLPLVKTLMVPPAWSHRIAMPQEHRDLFSYCNCVMEPWDGPAAHVATDSRWVVAGMDRNGLRPLRYSRTRDGLLVVGSETGMVPLPELDVVEKGRVGPGEAIAVDLANGRFYRDRELKDYLAGLKPYSQVGREHHPRRGGGDQAAVRPDDLRPARAASAAGALRPHPRGHGADPLAHGAGRQGGGRLDGRRHAARRPLQAVPGPAPLLPPAVQPGHQPADRPLARMAGDEPQDPLRQPRQHLRRGPEPDDDPRDRQPGPEHDRARRGGRLFRQRRADDRLHLRAEGDASLADALERIRQEAEEAIRGGSQALVLTDEHVSAGRAPIPMILAVGAVHSHLVRQGLRAYSSITVRSGECLDVHYFAVLIGVGATAVNAYLAEAAIVDRHARGLFPGLALDECLARFKEAVNQGLLKVMSKMGIAIISSYRGGYNFEAVGLSRSLCREYFPGLVTRISGIGLTGIRNKALAMHGRAFGQAEPPLAIGGFYRYRRGGETHAYEARLIHQLQHAVGSDSYQAYKRYAEMVHALEPISIRDLLDFNREEPGDPGRGGREHHRDQEALRDARHVARRARPRGARDAHDRHEPDRRQGRLRRGRRGPRALPPAGQRRQRQLGHQAGGLGPVRRHRRVPERGPRARDQGGPGGQARRGRPAAGLQGDGRRSPGCATPPPA